MADKQKDIKSMIELIISNIDEFDSKFVTYKAESMKELLENTLEYIKDKEQECKQLKKRLEQQEALTETYKVCYRAKHNDVKDRFIKYKQILDEIKEDISEYIKTPGFFEKLDSNSAITRDEYIAICTRHNLASEINNIVKKCDKKE